MFYQDTIKIEIQRDGVNFTVIEPVPFSDWAGHLYRVSAGATSDGLSGGKLAKVEFQDEHTFLPAIAHDAGYRNQLEESLDGGGSWQRVTLSKALCDEILRENIIDSGGSEAEAEVVYEAVKLFGQSSFDGDRESLSHVQ
jgi:hypothetical protein